MLVDLFFAWFVDIVEPDTSILDGIFDYINLYVVVVDAVVLDVVDKVVVVVVDLVDGDTAAPIRNCSTLVFVCW